MATVMDHIGVGIMDITIAIIHTPIIRRRIAVIAIIRNGMMICGNSKILCKIQSLGGDRMGVRNVEA